MSTVKIIYRSRSNISSKVLVCQSEGGQSHWYSLEGGKGGCRTAHGMARIGTELYILGGRGDTGHVRQDLSKLTIEN